MSKLLNEKNEFKLDYDIIKYKNNEYVVIKLNTKYIYSSLCIIDFDDFDKIKNLKWDLVNHYPGAELKIQGNKCYKSIATIYMHNFVMNRVTFEGYNCSIIVDHKNRIPTDNRKENLHLINQTEQNFNQGKKLRILELPKNSHIKVDDIPRGVSYINEFRNYGNGFEVYIKSFNGNTLKYYSSRDKSLSLRFKLEQVKKFLRYTKEKYPEEFARHHIETEYNDKEIELIDSYNEILKLSKFPDIDKHLIKYNIKNYLIEDLTNLTEEEINLLNSLQFENKTKKKLKTKLPDDCGITVDMIPKYCHYSKPRGNIGEYFVIDKHPKLTARCWNTTSNKKVTIQEKFDQLLVKLKELE